MATSSGTAPSAASAPRPQSPAPSDSSNASTESPIQALDPTAQDQWADVDPDVEDLSFQSLFDDTTFSSLDHMLAHDKETWAFDLRGEILRLELDFYSCIRLVNYVRSQVLDGQKSVSIPTTDVFQDDKFLQPVLQDDAVLFGLDDLLPSDAELQSRSVKAGTTQASSTQDDIRVLREQIVRLEKQLTDYRNAVEKTLDERWGADGSDLRQEASLATAVLDDGQARIDNGYFDSYAYHEIHETMLKDQVRTSAYRDFAYDNKHLFNGKVVLDIGCGTGILSMFAARAGAKHVYAVDNSAIISKATQIVADNNLQDTITCIRGKIEEIKLPVDRIDIIVSEWFGYGLLFENMLDSVLHARDLYSSPSTSRSDSSQEPHCPLMLPSHTTLHIAPLTDPEYIDSTISFWHQVYGFDMSAMLEPSDTTSGTTRTFPSSSRSNSMSNVHHSVPPSSPPSIYSDIIVRPVEPRAISAESARFKTLNLHTIPRQDLTFSSPFALTLNSDASDGLDGWVIWFDVFFLTNPQRFLNAKSDAEHDALPPNARGETWPGEDTDKGVAFTTGPDGKLTHWKQACLLIDRGPRAQRVPVPLSKGQKISGTVWYRKGADNPRNLDIEVEWAAEGTEERGRQTWYLR